MPFPSLSSFLHSCVCIARRPPLQFAFQTTDQRLAKREINGTGPLEWTRNALERPRNALERHRRAASGSKAAKKERREERNQEIKKRTKGNKGRN